MATNPNPTSNVATPNPAGTTPPKPPVAAAPTVPAPAKPHYLIIPLPAHQDEANAALAKAALDGYTKIESVYTLTSPSSASAAFAILSRM